MGGVEYKGHLKVLIISGKRVGFHTVQPGSIGYQPTAAEAVGIRHIFPGIFSSLFLKQRKPSSLRSTRKKFLCLSEETRPIETGSWVLRTTEEDIWPEHQWCS